MPAQRNALYLAQRTRFYVGVFDRSKLRDGFLTDKGEASRAILPAINEAIRQLTTTGQFKCRFSFTTTAGTREYTLDPAIGMIEWATYDTTPIEKTNMQTLNRKFATWQNANVATGTPTQWYNDIPDVFGLVRTPNAAKVVEFLAEVLADDLDSPDDVITRLPSQFNEDIAIGAAIDCITSLLGQIPGMDAAFLRKLEILTPRWNSGNPERPGAVERVQALAQQRELGETQSFEPLEYNKTFGRFGRRTR